MAIIGTHALLYTSEPEKLRAVLRDVFGFKYVDAGEGWLIFGLPPAELGVHPAEGPSFESGMRQQLTFMCDDIHATSTELRAKGIAVRGEPQNEGWGITVMLGLPGGVEVMLYEPRATLWRFRSSRIGAMKKVFVVFLLFAAVLASAPPLMVAQQMP